MPNIVSWKIMRTWMFFVTFCFEDLHNARCMLKCNYCKNLLRQSFFVNYRNGFQLGILMAEHFCIGKHKKYYDVSK